MNYKKFFNNIYVKIAAAVLILFAAAALFLYPGSKIAPGICVNEINIGGLTKDAAAEKLEEFSLNEQIITLTSNGQKTEFYGSDIDLKRDIPATVNTAYELGRSKNSLKNIGFFISSRFSAHSLTYRYSFSEEKLSDIIYNFGVSINGEMHEYLLDFSENHVNVQKGTAGQGSDVSKACNAASDAINNEIYETEIVLEKTQPKEPDAKSLISAISIAPVDASYEIIDGKVIFTPEQYGRAIDENEVNSMMEKLKNGEIITLSINKTAPNVTLADINAQLFGYELGKYSTVYSESNKSRSANVVLAASKIDGTILAPNEEFSYNDTVGKRSRENGFKEAQIYENSEVVLGLGGGVCQVSSTLYSAVLYADLKVTERRAHSMTVGYVPKGQDATVSYGTIDFKFKNNTKCPIKISASANNGKVEISILGTKPEKQKTVKIINTVTETNEPEIEEVPDKNLLTGNKKVISKGKTGYRVETVRKVYEDGIEVKSEKMSGSIYKSVATKVAIGAKVPEALPALPPLSTPVPDIPAVPAENETESE